MKYFSTFSGIGGFELGIMKAYETTRNTNVQEVGGGKEIEEGVNEEREGLHPISSEATLSPENRNNELLDTSPDERQPHCIGYSEIDKYATQIYQKHFPEHKNYGDIKLINEKELPEFDLFVGGFPCQSFSIAGKRGGFNDTRGTLFFDIARILKVKQPRLLLLENVKGLLSHDEGRTFATIISTLDELGYDCQWQVLNSKNHGVPQNRERVFIIGHLRGTARPKVFPYWGESNPNTTVSQSAETAVARTLTGGGHSGGNHSGMTILELSARHENREYREIAPTVQSSYGTGGGHVPLVMPQVRRLTPVECERLQGFPDGWTEKGINEKGELVLISDTQRYKMCGNAVTTCVIKEIVLRLLHE